MTVTFYGIPNCDTVKKARDWLAAKGIAYTFHDYRKEGADPARIARWVELAGWEKVLNRAGTTFRKLPDADKRDLDAGKAVAVMAANPSCIKRPVLEYSANDIRSLLIGFRPDEWEAALA
ncbi:MAG: arsenate reductase [Novosphingobium sp.]